MIIVWIIAGLIALGMLCASILAWANDLALREAAHTAGKLRRDLPRNVGDQFEEKVLDALTHEDVKKVWGLIWEHERYRKGQ